jgi:hypothetical protein
MINFTPGHNLMNFIIKLMADRFQVKDYYWEVEMKVRICLVLVSLVTLMGCAGMPPPVVREVQDYQAPPAVQWMPTRENYYVGAK